MVEKKPAIGRLGDSAFKILHNYDDKISESFPNLSLEDYSFFVYSTMGYLLGKCKYFGLTFPLEDSAHIEELKALSNGYVENRDGVVKMGVLKLENLERILTAPYLKAESVRID